MRHSDKHKTIFHHLLQLEKIRTNRTYVHKSRYGKRGLGYPELYIINDRDMTIEIQLKTLFKIT